MTNNTPFDEYELVKHAIESIIGHIGELFKRLELLEKKVDTTPPKDVDNERSG